MQRTHYIYGLLCPLTNRVRYVGKTLHIRERYGQHCRDTGAPDDGNLTDKQLWIKHLDEKGLKPRLVILDIVGRSTGPVGFANLSTIDRKAAESEKEWLDRLAAEGHPLTNKVSPSSGDRFIQEALELGRQMFGVEPSELLED